MAKKKYDEGIDLADGQDFTAKVIAQNLNRAIEFFDQPPPEVLYEIRHLGLSNVPASIAAPLIRLEASQIISVNDGAIEWRMGHLLHIANLYKGDPTKTERDYADDLAVARAYSADVWEALLK